MTGLLKYFILLNIRRFQRKCEEMGVHYTIVIFTTLLVFISGSYFLFFKWPIFAPIIYSIITLSLIYSSIDINHLQHISKIFDSRTALKIRIVEHLLISIPFLLFLSYKVQWLWMLGLLLGVTLLALLPAKVGSHIKIPTPFKRQPFEFIIGTRKTFPLIILSYFLMIKAIQVDNPNLGFAMIGFLFLLSISYHMKVEKEYFVWIYDKSPSGLLRMKILTAFKNASLLSIPGSIILLIAFPGFFFICGFLYFYGFILLTVFILGKYAAYPKEIGLPQAIIIGISILFPPMLIYTIPTFYKKAQLNLTPYLQC